MLSLSRFGPWTCHHQLKWVLSWKNGLTAKFRHMRSDAAPVARDCYQPGGSEDTGDALAQYRADRCRAVNKGC